MAIGEYSAKKNYFFPGRKKIVKKFPNIFHFQEWKIVQNCTFLGKKLSRLAYFGEKLKKIAPHSYLAEYSPMSKPKFLGLNHKENSFINEFIF